MSAILPEAAPVQPLSVLTPYLFPPGSNKVPNIGDGLILRAIERSLGTFVAERTLTSRGVPTEAQKQALLASRAVILAGANQLDDHFSPWPGLTADDMRRAPYRFVPMGIGLHGDPPRNARMSENTRQVMDIIHDRTPYSSWRCPRTLAYLLRELPHLESRALMTGCPVLYDTPLLDSSRFSNDQAIIAVTTTERDDFWMRETQTIDFVSKRFPDAKKVLVVHQDYLARHKPSLADQLVRRWSKTALALQHHARKCGFELVKPRSHDEAIGLYRSADMHFGSRLHAHLHMLSQNKRSFLTKVDERSTGIAEHFGFPLCNAARFEDYLNFDFETVRQAALRTFPVMQRFVDSVGR